MRLAKGLLKADWNLFPWLAADPTANIRAPWSIALPGSIFRSGWGRFWHPSSFKFQEGKAPSPPWARHGGGLPCKNQCRAIKEKQPAKFGKESKSEKYDLKVTPRRILYTQPKPHLSSPHIIWLETRTTPDAQTER